MQFLFGRLVFLVSTSCNGGINSTVVLNLAMTHPCLTCCYSASLQLVTTAAFCLSLVDSQAKLSCNFGLPTATFSENPLVCHCCSSHYRVVRPDWSIFHPASWWTIGCFLLALLVVGLGSPCSWCFKDMWSGLLGTPTLVLSFLPSASLPWQPSSLSWIPTALFTVVTGKPD